MAVHQEFGAQTDASTVAETFQSSIKDKVFLITGVGRGGIGGTTAKSLAAFEPRLLILAGRSADKVKAVISDIASSYPKVLCRFVQIDLSSPTSIREAATTVLAYEEPLHVLINNAGLMALSSRTLTPQGIEMQFQTNHLGPFLFTNLLLPKLLSAGHTLPANTARVVNLSSSGHALSPVRFSDLTFAKPNESVPPEEQFQASTLSHLGLLTYDEHYVPMAAYGQAKTASILFSIALNTRLAAKGHSVSSFSLHPGSIDTELQRHWDPKALEHARQQSSSNFVRKTLEQGASTTLVAALDPGLELMEGEVGYLSDCRFAEPAEWCRGEKGIENAERLWKISEELVDGTHGTTKAKGSLSNKNAAHPNKKKPIKLWNARKILAEPPDKALNKNGDLDVGAFVKAREFEIQAIDKSMTKAPAALNSRAFQSVPRDMRRRTASHNVKKIPKRLRSRAMKDDKTVTGAARVKKLTSHKRLRSEKAKRLMAKGRLKKAQRAAAKKTKPGETDPEKLVQIVPRFPNPKKNKLVKPPKPPAKFRRRQRDKSWLPTHIWHAKRAHMTAPKYPLWRFALPLSPTNKVFRTSHRASVLRGCIAWDMSYMGTIAIEGVEPSVLGLLRSVGVEEQVLTGKSGAKWRKGVRSWEGWIKERDNDKRPIAPVQLVWCAQDETLSISGEKRNKFRRQLFLRVHPSAYLQVWNEVLKISKMQRPIVMVEDLRFEIGSIEITGPGSTEALLAALHPISNEEVSPEYSPDAEKAQGGAEQTLESDWEDVETPQRIWSRLAGLSNPSALPARALLAFNVMDPRLRSPPRTVPNLRFSETDPSSLNILAEWPPDQTQSAADIFDHKKRLTASHRLASQKSINRRKGEASPGDYPSASPTDPHIPILLLASRPAPQNSNQGSWMLLLPWDCVLPVWYTLVHYPLSTGGNPRFGGLLEKGQITFEQGRLWFPGAFPGTKAGWEWEILERDKVEIEWRRKPKGRRTEFDSTDLGEGRRGEIGKGWACDWERLLLGKDGAEALEVAKDAALQDAAKKDDGLASQAGDDPKDRRRASDQLKPENTHSEGPPHAIHHVSAQLINRLFPSVPLTALSPIHIQFLTGHVSRNARIYRLPTADDTLFARWQALSTSSSTKESKTRHNNQTRTASSRPQSARDRASLPQHERAAALAVSLLQPPISRLDGEMKPGHPNYPPVPDENDLIGFVVYANYHLGEGKVQAVGNVLVHRALGLDLEKALSAEESAGKGKGKDTEVSGTGQEKVVRFAGKDGGGKGKGKGRKDGNAGNEGKKGVSKVPKGGICIVRDAGQGLGRLAKWEWAS
ncbi:uncharacterized protein KY384_006378 [Bacidia gigantensis]|uniref:uncharacterized protein n=1 Tax=Bacidia gigantensis TaxID=2732470 RepID=UPI001D03BE64|nr:uncharacterized protein KY384_006378 [Bacidia gigantensis]KAG8528691.1 hypothetical protein KY384_006378 [Bacidia gigantensis]